MKKRHTFWIKRHYSFMSLCYANGYDTQITFCYPIFLKKFGIKLKFLEKKKIAITIEEVK